MLNWNSNVDESKCKFLPLENISSCVVHLHDNVLKLCSTEGLCVEEKGGMHSLKEEFLEHAEQRSKEG